MKDKFYYSDGTTSEYEDDEKVLHREDGPAVELEDGGRFWYLNGKRHRVDGPAIEYAHGTEGWYLHGELHRADGGPAVEHANGDKSWFFEGKRHREDGPAIEFADGDHRWCVNGNSVSCIPHYILIKYMKVNNLTVAHLFTDSDPLVRESVASYKWDNK